MAAVIPLLCRQRPARIHDRVITPGDDTSADVVDIKGGRYQARYLGGLWGIFGPKGFVGCSGWTYAEVAGRVRTMNAVVDALDAIDGPA